MLNNIGQRLYWKREKLRIGARAAWITLRNRWRKRSVVGTADVAVSLTTHGARLQTVHAVIESICAGTVRPRRLVLWLNPGPSSVLPKALTRLQAHGLEIRYVDNYGPHTKYYPYVTSIGEHACPMVTADDDMLYPPFWLERLVKAYEAEPQYVHCYRARRVKLAGGRLAPYGEWGFDTSGQPSFHNFATGVSGVIYPPVMMNALRDAGDAFRSCCPKADDVWLHAMAIRRGYRVKQLSKHEMHFEAMPETQSSALFHTNLIGSGNDDQIAATYQADDLRALGEEPETSSGKGLPQGQAT